MRAFAMIASLPMAHVLPWVHLYVGPDVFLPFTSALAAIAGFLLMFWHRIVSVVRRLTGRGPKPDAQPPASKPGADHT